MDVLALSSAGLLEAAPDAIVGVGVDGRIALVNAHVERLFGYQRRELVGQPVEMLVPLSARAAHQLLREGYFHDLTPRSMGAGEQLAGRRKNGTEFPADISLSALHTGNGVMVFAAVRDVTERIEAQAERDRLKEIVERERYEARLQQSERLESLGQLAGGIAHDFNNLLAVILNYSAFVAEEITAAAAEDGEDRWRDTLQDIAQIRRAGDRAAELTHGIVVQARGDVHIYSTPDIGTTVSVLPVTEEDHVPHPHPAPVTWTSGGETVLVVDDEPALREVTCRILSRNGYQVLSAGSGAEALALAREHDGAIDLLVTDVIMPQMFGKEVAEAMVTLRPETRVLYMSGYAQPVLSSQGTLDAGVVLVEKPFSESALLQKVHEVLDQQA